MKASAPWLPWLTPVLANWAMLLSRKSVGGTQDYTDQQATNRTARFYRVIVP